MSEHATAGAVSQLSDISAPERELFKLCVVSSNTGDCVLSGHFVDLNGVPLPSVDGGSTYGLSATVSTTAKTLAGVFSLTAIPSKAVGFIGRLTTNALAYSWAASSVTAVNSTVKTDMETNYAYYPQIAISDDLRIGRC